MLRKAKKVKTRNPIAAELRRDRRYRKRVIPDKRQKLWDRWLFGSKRIDNHG